MPRPAKPAAKKTKPNPYLGFGWVGWVGVVVIVALAIAAFRGWDPVYQLMWYVSFSLEQNPIYWGVAGGCANLWTINANLSFVNGPFIAAVLIWVSRRGVTSLGWSIVLGIWSVILPLLWYPILVGSRNGVGPFSRSVWIDTTHFSVILVSIAIAYVATRSGWLAVAWFAMFLIGWYEKFMPIASWRPLTMNVYWTIWFTWQIAFVCLNIAWAILAVRRLPGEHQCPKCLYDLTNLPSTTCPECGEDVSAVVELAAS